MLETKTDIWFRGAYLYYVPKSDGSLAGKLEYWQDRANKLLQTDLTPSVLWQLAPWSWLVDWFTEVGNSIKNFSALASDNLVVKYGYLMIRQEHKHTIQMSNLSTRQGGNLVAVNPSCSFTTISKERFRATPYGFGIDLNSLTARQWSILAALGMTRSPNKLRSN